MEPIDAFDSSCALEMVTSEAISLSLERIDDIDSMPDNEHPWLFPNRFRPTRPWYDSLSNFSKETPYLTQLRSTMASWLDLSESDKELPFCNGSLITLPWQHSQEPTEDQAVFRLVIYSISQEEEGGVDSTAETMCILAKDLPYLLLKSSSESISAERESVDTSGRVPLSTGELLLNLLPRTPHLSAEESSEIASNLTGDLECFDSILLSGELGSGKTHLALVLAALARLNSAYATLYLDCKRLQSSPDVRMKGILQALTDVFREATKAGQCLVVLDDIDELIPNISMGSDEDEGSAHQQQPNPVAADQSKLIADHLQNLINSPTSTGEDEAKIFLVMTCREEQSIHPTAIAQRFYRSASVPPFNAVGRETLFLSMLRKGGVQETLSTQNGTTLRQDFGSKTEGFRPRDLHIVAMRVLHRLKSQHRSSSDQRLEVDDTVESALIGYTPISRQGIRAEDTRSTVTWSHIGGLFRTKKSLSSTILRPVKYRRVYQHAPIRLPRGIMLFGPSGCGKSYLVPALAKECGLTLITCRGPELLDKYIGASEAKVRQLFQRAYAAAPSLLFLDEFDALAPVRGSDRTGVTDRVVNQLLTYLDGVEDASMGSVYIVAATSRPDKVDPALLRPGRLEQHIFVGFPSTEEEWYSVLEQTLSDREIDSHLEEKIQNRKLWEAEDFSHIDSFSPSDIKAVVDTAYLNAVHEFLAHNKHVSGEVQESPVTIQTHHMVKALKSTRPSLSAEDRRMLTHVYRPYISGDRPDDDEPAPTNERTGLLTALK